MNNEEQCEQPRSQPASSYTNAQWVLVVLAIFSSALLYGLDSTIVVVSQGPITARFNEVSKLGWLGIGFPLGSIATIAPWGKAYSVFDTKWLFLLSLVHFAAGSLLCGAAPDMDTLIVGRVWAGAGGAGIYLGQLNIIIQNVAEKKRGIYMNAGSACWGLGSIVGPLIGGAFADSSATWRWGFYMNLVLFGLFSPIYLFVMESHMPCLPSPLRKRLAEFDWLGIFLNAAMYTAFVIGFAIGGTIWPWSDTRTITSIAACGVILILFSLQQCFAILTTKEARVFPVHFLRSRTFILLFIAQSCAQTALAVPLYYIPLFFQFVRSETAVESSLRLLPFMVVNIAALMANATLLPKPKFNCYSMWYLASSILTTVGSALFFGLLKPNSSTAAIYGYSIIIALGAGLGQQMSYTVAGKKAEEHAPDAISLMNCAQLGSTVIALTITSLIFQNVGYHNVKHALAGLDASAGEIRAALGGADSHFFDYGTDEGVRVAVQSGIANALRWSFVAVLVAGTLGIFASLSMKNEKLKFEGTEEAVEEHKHV
ncbi:MFS general substrate transporter [Massarina eburnea CBS 473.64]|uniref:MFS general substrate transporter n=1 Tax=Massarina eburnea CBS 473.64 TaxID=1395130 RepID=A0A6A6S645_9PLEO|nr:MFS general substrate transporter [Massarina eburnea CBS 473.64]